MLYVSTRNKVDSFTAHRVLHTDAAPDGELFMPMQVPVLSDIQLAELEQMNFGQSVAYIMNLLFGTELTGWDVDFAVGRQATTLVEIGHKVSVSENWHNPAGEYDYFVRRLYTLVCGEKFPKTKPNVWFCTASYIALLFGTYGRLCRRGIYTWDVAVQTGELQQLLAIRYAQKMGLPVERIILGSLEGDGLWELFSYGDYQVGRKGRPDALEALLWLEFGAAEVQNYLKAIETRGIYKLNPLDLETLRKGIFIAVMGDGRAQNVAAGTKRSAGYAMESSTARAFGALQDYRAKHGENRNTLLLADIMPDSPKEKQRNR